MHIHKLETFCNEFVGFVRLTTDSGATGWGQISTYNADITATVFHRQIAPWSLGADALDIQTLVDTIPERERLRGVEDAGLSAPIEEIAGKIARPA